MSAEENPTSGPYKNETWENPVDAIAKNKKINKKCLLFMGEYNFAHLI
jgi:hypothetical protein